MPARSTPPPPTPLRRLTTEQDYVVTRAQLQRAGWSAGQIRTELAARRWQAVGRRVIVTHNAVPTASQRRWIAALLLAQPAALAAATAVELHGLRGFEDDRVHLVVDRACSARLPPWVRLHNSRRFSLVDIDPGSALARTRVDRAVIDTAAWSSRPRRACAVLCAAVQQRLTTADRLAVELDRAGDVSFRRIMSSVLGDIGGGGHTLSEIALAPLAAAAGLPAPRRQALRRGSDGRARYVDAEFDLPDGQILVVEIDGAVHLRPQTWWDDLARQNDLVIDRANVLRFDTVTTRLEPARVTSTLRRIRDAHPARVTASRR